MGLSFLHYDDQTQTLLNVQTVVMANALPNETRRQDLMKASKSGLRTSAWVVSIP